MRETRRMHLRVFYNKISSRKIRREFSLEFIMTDLPYGQVGLYDAMQKYLQPVPIESQRSVSIFVRKFIKRSETPITNWEKLSWCTVATMMLNFWENKFHINIINNCYQ